MENGRYDEDDDDIVSNSQPATQPLNHPLDDTSEDESSSEETDTWGMLYPIQFRLRPAPLILSKIRAGRSNDNEIAILGDVVPEKFLNTISKRHFIIEKTDNGVMIHDKSSNGTSINGSKIGRNRVKLIEHNMIIKLGDEDCYVFMRTESRFYSGFPRELRSTYMISRQLGKGACGIVHMAFRKSDGHRFALKCIDKKRMRELGSQVPAENEAELTKKADHPCIIKLYDMFQTEDQLYLILEYGEGGELFDRVLEQRRLSEKEAKIYFYQMTAAVIYLHSINIAHRDLKPENMLLCNKSQPILKITDLGLSKEVSSSGLQTLVGTPQYLAPEVMIGKVRQKKYDMSVDNWSLGAILYVILSGTMPFNKNQKDLAKQIIDCNYNFNGREWRDVSAEAKDLISRLMTYPPKNRISAEEAIKHPWLANDPELIANVKTLISTFKPSQPAPPINARGASAASSTVTEEFAAARKRPHPEVELEFANENQSINVRPCKRMK